MRYFKRGNKVAEAYDDDPTAYEIRAQLLKGPPSLIYGWEPPYEIYLYLNEWEEISESEALLLLL